MSGAYPPVARAPAQNPLVQMLPATPSAVNSNMTGRTLYNLQTPMGPSNFDRGPVEVLVIRDIDTDALTLHARSSKTGTLVKIRASDIPASVIIDYSVMAFLIAAGKANRHFFVAQRKHALASAYDMLWEHMPA